MQVECVFDARWNDEKVSKGVAILFFFNRYWKVVKICEGCISYFRIKRRLAIKVSRSKRRSKKKEILFDTRHLIYIKYSNSLHDLSMHAVELSQHCWIVGWRPSPGGPTSPQTLIVHLVDLCLEEWCVSWPAEVLKKGSYFPLSSWWRPNMEEAH